jgi:hypothetical protein
VRRAALTSIGASTFGSRASDGNRDVTAIDIANVVIILTVLRKRKFSERNRRDPRLRACQSSKTGTRLARLNVWLAKVAGCTRPDSSCSPVVGNVDRVVGASANAETCWALRDAFRLGGGRDQLQ